MDRRTGLVASEAAGPGAALPSLFGLPEPGGTRTEIFQGAVVAAWPVPEDTPAKPHQAKVLPIRVLHVINGEHYAGAERVQDLLALHLPEFGFEVAFAALKPGVFAARRRCRQVPVFEMPMRHRLDIRPAWRLARLIRQESYRLLHAHTPRSLLVGWLAAQLAGVPLVYHVHSPAWADSTRWFFNWANAVLERLLLRRADRIICVSQALVDQMRRQGLKATKITVVPNGTPLPTAPWQPSACFQKALFGKEVQNRSDGCTPIPSACCFQSTPFGKEVLDSGGVTPCQGILMDQPGWIGKEGPVGKGLTPGDDGSTQPDAASGSAAGQWETESGTDAGGPDRFRWTDGMRGGACEGSESGEADRCVWTLGTVALFRPRKGIEVLLEALALLAQRGVPVRLRAVGPFETDAYQATVQQKAAHLGLTARVHWTGPVEDIETELLKMDIFVLPSLFGEGLPMVLLEAMAVGMPIVASRIDGLEEVIRPGQEGLLVEPGSPHALAQAIEHLLAHPEEAIRLAPQARHRHQQHYSAQAMAAGVAQVYQQLLANRSRPDRK